jgi:hypothetical protein
MFGGGGGGGGDDGYGAESEFTLSLFDCTHGCVDFWSRDV